MIWKASRVPRDAALFSNHDPSYEHEFIYFSPGAAKIAKSIVDEFKGIACSAPAFVGTALLIGHADARQSLLLKGSDRD
ncbi:MAG: hypothetical protein QOD84_2076 [Acidobacteriaceae bacterium]|jgi:hypothetical protein